MASQVVATEQWERCVTLFVSSLGAHETPHVQESLGTEDHGEFRPQDFDGARWVEY